MKVIIIVSMMLVNSLLGYLTAILDICVQKNISENNWKRYLLRPWSKFFNKTISYNLSMNYVAVMTVCGPIPKIILNLLFFLLALCMVVIMSVISIYGFTVIYVGNRIKYYTPISKKIIDKHEKKLTIKKAFIESQRCLDEENSPLRAIIILLLLITCFIIIPLIIH